MMNPKLNNITYSEIEKTGWAYWSVFSFFALLAFAGWWAYTHIHQHGHYVTAMNNQIVWGMPHVFAIFLIIAASGAANVATIGGVFGKRSYQPYGRLSLLLAVSLLIGGLAVLLLDLGHIGHVIEMPKGALNFQSVFAWNVILYSGYCAIIAVYLWTMMSRSKRAKRIYKYMGLLSLIWRFLLTMGTALIFGVLVARPFYDAILLVPLFIAASYLFGAAIYILLLILSFKLSGRILDDAVLERFRVSLRMFIALLLGFELIRYVANVLVTEHQGFGMYILTGDQFSALFWLGQIALGSILPLFLLWASVFKNNRIALIAASALVIVGGLIQITIIVIGGQSYPLPLFLNSETSSRFADGVFNAYSATLPEYLLGFAGIGIAFCLVLLGLKLLRLLPDCR